MPNVVLQGVVSWGDIIGRGASRNVRIGLGKKVEQLDEHLAQLRLSHTLALAIDLAAPAVQEQVADVLGGQDLVAQVEGDGGGLAVEERVGKDLSGGLWVDEDVELGKGRVVADALLAVDLAQRGVGEAVADGATHEAQAGEVGGQVRVLAE